MPYQAPIKDMLFALEEIAGLAGIAALPRYAEATPDTVAAVLEEAGRFVAAVLDPLNVAGDRQGARLVDGAVRTTEGWKQAYAAFAAGGWNGVSFAPEHGGMGLPSSVGATIQEMINGANMAFALCPLLTQGAIEAILLNGSPAQHARFLPNLVTGRWTGTMNLTEPQAGSDLAALRTRAVREGEHYRITGQKIFITYGDHDLAENIIHLVLARLPDAPPGVKGISLFIVPKFLVNDDGSLGARNDVQCVSLEHKLGIHGSPTAVMAYGAAQGSTGAIGYVVGEENRGLEYMFVMMNQARLSVGIQGLGIAERAYQRAAAYADERVQGAVLGDATAARRPIRFHPDVHRMLMQMRARTEAMRALAVFAAGALDRSQGTTGEEARTHWARLELLIPIVKGWCTETANDVASTAVQVHGGMGYIEETGAAQHFRDARITAIYEGTTGIQANDLIGRKLLRDRGAAALALIGELRGIEQALAARPEAPFPALQKAAARGLNALETALGWLATEGLKNPRAAFGAGVNLIHLFGLVTGGLLLFKSALRAAERLAAGDTDREFLSGKIGTAAFYAGQIMPEAIARRDAVLDAGAGGLALDPLLSPGG